MNPFQNESESASISGLTIENRTDRVSIYGTLDVSRDKAGQRDAHALKQVVDAIVAALDSADLPDKVAKSETKTAKNPFR